jgi:CheY-like chemotaxis protein
VPTAPILIAEDDEHDAELVRLALKKGGITNPVRIVTNGAETIAYLKAEPPYSDRQQFPFPRLLLLDIKMPVLNGFEVLRWIRSHSECSVVPIVMMSSSRLDSDVETAYRFGANAYMSKPGSFADLVEQFTRLQKFWEICELPKLPVKCE